MKNIFLISLLLLLSGISEIFSGDLQFQIAEDYKSGKIDYHQYLVYRGYILFDSKKLFTIYPENSVLHYEKCGTGIIMELTENWDMLTKGEKDYFSQFINAERPNIQTSIKSPSGFFKIHFDTTGTNKVPSEDTDKNGIPDFVDVAATAFDSALYVYYDELGYKKPFGDNGTDGDEFDVYIKELNNIYGQTFLPPNMYIEVDNDFENNIFYTKGTDALRVTAAHELHHAVQMSYRINSSYFYFYEMTSTYYEDYVFDNIDDYFQYLPGFFSKRHLPFNTRDGYFEYGQSLYCHYLEKRFDEDTLTRIWEQFGYRNISMITAIDIALSERDSDFDMSLHEFNIWNYFTGSRADVVNFYSEGDKYPAEITEFEKIPAQADKLDTLKVGYLSAQYISLLNLASENYNITLYSDDGLGEWRNNIIFDKNLSGTDILDFEMINNLAESVILPNKGSTGQAVLIATSTAKNSGNYPMNIKVDRNSDKYIYNISEAAAFDIADNLDIISTGFSDETSLIIKFIKGNNRGKHINVTNLSTKLPEPLKNIPEFSSVMSYYMIEHDIDEEYSASIKFGYSIDTLLSRNIPETELTLASYDSTELRWKILETSIDINTNIATARTDTFSLLAVTNKNDSLLKEPGPVPVEFLVFSYNISDGENIRLSWVNEDEYNIYGYEIEKSINKDFFEKIGFVPKNSQKNYKYSVYDRETIHSTIFYRIKALYFDGFYEYSDILIVENIRMPKYELFQSYPNPFNPVTTIRFEIPAPENVSLIVYNISGREIKTLLNEYKKTGIYEVKWDGTDNFERKVSSGIYIYKLNAGKFSKSLKTSYLK